MTTVVIILHCIIDTIPGILRSPKGETHTEHRVMQQTFSFVSFCVIATSSQLTDQFA